MMKTAGIEKRSGKETGGSLVFLMSIVLVLAATSAAMLGVASSRGKTQLSDRDAQIAYTAADSGIDQAVALSQANSFSALAQNAYTDLATSYVGSAAVNVRVNRMADTVDNSTSPPTTVHTLRVESTATYGAQTRSVVGFLRQVEIPPVDLVANIPAIESAVMLGDPFSQVAFNGNSFTIKGADKNIDGTNGSGAAVYGIGIGPQSNGTPGNPTQVTSQLSNQQKQLITGKGSTPSVGSVNPVQINSVISALAPYANITFNNNSGTYTNALGSYPNSPKLVYSNGNLKVSGNAGGYGIMVVSGNLEIDGNWPFTGLLFVGGKLTFSGGGNTKKLTGAVLVDGDTQDLSISGNINIQYSSQAITNVKTYLQSLNPPSSATTPYSFVSSAETRKLN